jgi:hypothetical protein
MWIPNRDRFPERELRNADQLYTVYYLIIMQL